MDPELAGSGGDRPAVELAIFFGDDHRGHLPSLTRLAFQNVNGLPASSTAGRKQKHNIQWLKEERVGIALLAETNTHWPSGTIGCDRWALKAIIRLLRTMKTALVLLRRALSMADAWLLF